MKEIRIAIRTTAKVSDERMEEIAGCFTAHAYDEQKWLKEEGWIGDDDEVTAEIVEPARACYSVLAIPI